MNLSDFTTNKNKEVEGVWHDLGDGTKVLVARARNAKYIKMLRDVMKPYQNRLQRNDPTMEQVAEDKVAEVMAKTILLDWVKMMDEGKEVKYSTEKCLEVLKDDKYKDFREFIESLSEDMSQYQDEDKEDIVKN